MLTRIITGVVGILIAGAVINTGGLVFSSALILIAVLTWHEFSRAIAKLGYNIMLIEGGLFMGFMVATARLGIETQVMGSLFLAVMVLLGVGVLNSSRYNVIEILLSLAGLVYIGLPFAHLGLLRSLGADMTLASLLGNFSLGQAMVWLMFIGTWASDSCAYFVGVSIGKYPLAPKISPKKTVEGFIGGIIGTTVIVTLAGKLMDVPINLLQLLLLGAFIAVLATVGDLVESLIKRYTGIKDSGMLIPGHGGIWDRFDSVLFTAPLVYYFTLIVI